MSFSLFFQLFLNSLIAGSLYALVASGFSLISVTSRISNFAHGVMVTLAGYSAYFFFTGKMALLGTVFGGMPFWLASICGVLGTGGIGMLFFELVFRVLEKKKATPTILLIASVALLLLFENLILLLFGADVKSFNVIPVERGKDFFGAIITPLQITIIAVAVGIFLLFFFWMRYTKVGRAVRAVADAPELSAIIGIPVIRLRRIAFFLASCIAGVGGILIGLEQNLETTMGTQLVVKGFTGSVVGGINSLPGSILGSFLVGIAENYGIWYIQSGWKDAITFGLLFLFLLIRPQGILGVRKVREEKI